MLGFKNRIPQFFNTHRSKTVDYGTILVHKSVTGQHYCDQLFSNTCRRIC